MIRLTERCKSVVLCRSDCPAADAKAYGLPDCTICSHFLDMLERLAAYEDTGLTPQEIQLILEGRKKK